MTSQFHIAGGDQHEFATSERCFITELLNDPSLPDASLARARVKPGITTKLHALDVEEIYIIETGEGTMEVGGERFHVTQGDSVRIPAGTAQRITNDGITDLVFLCLCRPRFLIESYTSLETEGEDRPGNLV